MDLLKIVHFPNEILKIKSTPVDNIDSEIVNLANSMINTMYSALGIGLAASQIGVPKNLFVIDLGVQIENGSAITLINPRITALNGSKAKDQEGCLSIPEIYAEITRQEAIEVKGFDINGKEVVLELDGLLSRAIQHEIDHFNGVLFWDHLGKIKKDMLKRKFKKLQNEKLNQNAGKGNI